MVDWREVEEGEDLVFGSVGGFSGDYVEDDVDWCWGEDDVGVFRDGGDYVFGEV